MDLQTRIVSYLHQPLPLWDNCITELLIANKWKELLQQIFSNPEDYSIVGCVIKDMNVKEINWTIQGTNELIQIAEPSDDISSFYEEHGIEPVAISYSQSEKEVLKVRSALSVFQDIPPVYSFILQIVKSLQIIKAENAETDISYSHPDIPFSIFFSVCDKVSAISDLRVAESIFHEAMHLKLTLIENIVPLIKPKARGVYFSPWRDELRPARGVLHGLFVFRGLLDFFIQLIETSRDLRAMNYLNERIEQIKIDIRSISSFASCEDLTEDGANLAKNLLPLN